MRGGGAVCPGGQREDVATVIRWHVRQEGRIARGGGSRVTGRKTLLRGGFYLKNNISALGERVASPGEEYSSGAPVMGRRRGGAGAQFAGRFLKG